MGAVAETVKKAEKLWSWPLQYGFRVVSRGAESALSGRAGDDACAGSDRFSRPPGRVPAQFVAAGSAARRARNTGLITSARRELPIVLGCCMSSRKHSAAGLPSDPRKAALASR